MQSCRLSIYTLAALVACCWEVRAAEDSLDEVVITASLRPVAAADLPASTTVLSGATTRSAGVQHFAEVLALVPGLTAAGGTSRPRYFQLRGVGEQEQYQGAPNPSVGFLIDGMDFSGAGMPATLFDVRQIEVLRGPQSAAYGANALAGLINVRSEAATATPFNALAEFTDGDYRTRSAGLALGAGHGTTGTAGAFGWRLAAQQARSDGYMRNRFLRRDDTNGTDEQTLRLGLYWQPSAALTAQLTLLHANLDNGYDAWTIDNTRNSQSDAPGRDSQRANGGALRLRYAGPGPGVIESLTSVADSRGEFSYDGDWGNNAFWAAQPACKPAPALCVPYDFTSRTLRHRRTVAQDLRWLSDDAHRLAGRVSWLLGVYALRLREDNAQLDLYNSSIYRQLASSYAATSLAWYGELGWPLGARTALTAALRGEQRRADYSDSDRSSFAPQDRMLGGNISWQLRHSDAARSYLTLARGYKAGGFNIGASIPIARRQFRPEYLWNLELGTKWSSVGARLQWQADVFRMRRLDQQVSTSVQTDPSDPLSFDFYTDNAARGETTGAEGALQWQATSRWQIDATLALLRARFADFSYHVVDYDAAGNASVQLRDLAGREQEYAPAQQYSLAVTYRRPAGGYLRADIEHLAGYYFSASHDQRATARTLVNLRAGLERGHWDLSLWLRNAFDASYAMHGFYFGNEPPDFANKLYLSPGEPRHAGITLRYRTAP